MSYAVSSNDTPNETSTHLYEGSFVGMIIATGFPWGGYWDTSAYRVYTYAHGAVLYYTISGNTLSWYNKVSSGYQFNAQDTYHYVVFG